jgi:hypothetical protein
MNSDITVPELDELIENINKKIDLIREYGPSPAIDISLEEIEPILSRISEYTARCNVPGYTELVFHAGRSFGGLRDIVDFIVAGIELGIITELDRPCIKCTSKEVTYEFLDHIIDLLRSVKFFVSIASEYLRENCCPVSEEEILKHV